LSVAGAHAAPPAAARATAGASGVLVVGLVMVVAALLAAGIGLGLAWWLQPLLVRTAGLAAALAAAVAVLVVAAPLGGVWLRVVRRAQAAAADVSGQRQADDSLATSQHSLPPRAQAQRPSRQAALPPADAHGAGHGPAQAPASRGAGTPAGEGARGTAAALGAGVVPLGLALSRETFMDMVAREWSRSRRYGTGAALLLVEIDRYPRLIEALGHAAGEKVLAEVLNATAPTLRGADALARYEAGRFTVFLAHADATGALDVAERIRDRAEQMEVAVAPRRVRFTVSVGVAHLRPAHLYLQALIDDVTDALAAARQAGGNCVRAAPVDVGARPAPGAAPRDGSRADKK
jgi:diguanylate cyclase (GGDEF)-like protein